MDTVPLDKLVGRRVGPELVGSLHLGVLQGAGPHCRADGAGSPSPRRVLPPSSHQKDHSPPAARVPQAPAKERPAQEPGSERQGAVLKVGGWREARQALRRCPLEPRPEIQMKLRALAGPLTQQRCKDGAVHRVHQESFLLVILTGKRKGHAGLDGDQQRAPSRL